MTNHKLTYIHTPAQRFELETLKVYDICVGKQVATAFAEMHISGDYMYFIKYNYTFVYLNNYTSDTC